MVKTSKSNKKPADTPGKARTFLSKQAKFMLILAFVATSVMALGVELITKAVLDDLSITISLGWVLIIYEVLVYGFAFVSTFILAIHRDRSRFRYVFFLALLLFFGYGVVPEILSIRYIILALLLGWFFAELCKTKNTGVEIKIRKVNKIAKFVLVCIGVLIITQLILDTNLRRIVTGIIFQSYNDNFVSSVSNFLSYLVTFIFVFILTIGKDKIRRYYGLIVILTAFLMNTDVFLQYSPIERAGMIGSVTIISAMVLYLLIPSSPRGFLGRTIVLILAIALGEACRFLLQRTASNKKVK